MRIAVVHIRPAPLGSSIFEGVQKRPHLDERGEHFEADQGGCLVVGKSSGFRRQRCWRRRRRCRTRLRLGTAGCCVGSAKLRVLNNCNARSQSARSKRRSPRVLTYGKIRRRMSTLMYRGVQLRCLAISALVTQVRGFVCCGMKTCWPRFGSTAICRQRGGNGAPGALLTGGKSDPARPPGRGR